MDSTAPAMPASDRAKHFVSEFRLAAVACLLISQAACFSVPIPPSAIHPDAVTQSSPDIFVLTATDSRPNEQRVGKKAPLVPLILWNSRIGTYITGDQAFTQRADQAVTNGLASAFDGGRFGRAAVGTNVTPDSICAESGPRFVATTEIRDLYATLHQSDFFLFLGFYIAMESETTDPVGHARLGVRVQDCRGGEIVLDREFESEATLPGGTLSVAATNALANVLNQVKEASR